MARNAGVGAAAMAGLGIALATTVHIGTGDRPRPVLGHPDRGPVGRGAAPSGAYPGPVDPRHRRRVRRRHAERHDRPVGRVQQQPQPVRSATQRQGQSPAHRPHPRVLRRPHRVGMDHRTVRPAPGAQPPAVGARPDRPQSADHRRRGLGQADGRRDHPQRRRHQRLRLPSIPRGWHHYDVLPDRDGPRSRRRLAVRRLPRR